MGDQRYKHQIALLAVRNELQASLRQTRENEARDTKGSSKLPQAVIPQSGWHFLIHSWRQQRREGSKAKTASRRLSRTTGASNNASNRSISKLRTCLPSPSAPCACQGSGRLENGPSMSSSNMVTSTLVATPTSAGTKTTSIGARAATTRSHDLFSARATARQMPRGFENSSAACPRILVYLAFCVFEDSFPEFIRVEEMATASNIALGWEPFQNQEGPVSFGSVGHTPKPQ